MTGGILEWAVRLLSRTASGCLIVMMGVTVADVIGRSLFATPIFGAFEIVGIMLVGTIFLALPETFSRDQHVTVDIIDQAVPSSVRRACRIIAALLSLGFVAVMTWTMVRPASDALRFGEVTLDLKMPLWVFWGPMLLGMAASTAALVAFLVRLLREKERSYVE